MSHLTCVIITDVIVLILWIMKVSLQSRVTTLVFLTPLITSGAWIQFRTACLHKPEDFFPVPSCDDSMSPQAQIQKFPLDFCVQITIRFPINFDGRFFFQYWWKGQVPLRGLGASLFPEEHYGLKNLRVRDCTGEFLIFKHIESVIFSFSGLKKWDLKRWCQIISREQKWANLINLEESWHCIFISYETVKCFYAWIHSTYHCVITTYDFFLTSSLCYSPFLVNT